MDWYMVSYFKGCHSVAGVLFEEKYIFG